MASFRSLERQKILVNKINALQRLRGHQSPIPRTLVSVGEATCVTKRDPALWTPESDGKVICVLKFDRKVIFNYVQF